MLSRSALSISVRVRAGTATTRPISLSSVRFTSTTAETVSSPTPPAPEAAAAAQPPPPTSSSSPAPPAVPRAHKFSTPESLPSPAPSTSAITSELRLNREKTISDSVRELLPQLRSQRPHFAQVNIYGKPYLVTEGDTIRLPFWMHGVQPGDVLRLDAATLLGSRDYVLKPGAGFGTSVVHPSSSRSVTAPATNPSEEVSELADNATIVFSDGSEPIPVREAVGIAGFVPPVQKTRYIDDRLFVCRATVVGVETEPLRVEIKKKQRTRRQKHATSKHRYTVLRISELTIRSVEEAEATPSRQT